MATPLLAQRAGARDAATERRVLLHAGFAKTASTTLQAGFFDHLPDIGFLG